MAFKSMQSGRLSSDGDDMLERIRALRERGPVERPEPPPQPTAEEIAEQHAGREREQFRSRAAVPPLMLGWTWDAIPAGAIAAGKEAIEALAADRDVMLVGPTGVGKTGIAICLLRDWIRSHTTGRYIFLPEWLKEVNDCYRREDASSLDLIREISDSDSPRLIVLDDLGAEVRHSEAVQRDVGLVVHRRQVEMRRTVVTTNLSPNEVRAAYGERTFSRLREYQLVSVGGKDQRGKR